MQKIAIQGIKGSFHQAAAEQFFGDEDISYLECMSFPEVIKSVRGSDADVGVIAIENALIGTILPNYKLIAANDLFVVGEVYLPIQLDLLALPGQTIEDIKEIWSHPLAIAQSEEYLDSGNWQVVKRKDTATCAKEISQQNLKGIGVLASPVAKKAYKLDSLQENVQNESDTYTRFFIVSSKENKQKDNDKASLSFVLKNKSGNLVNLLQKISDLNINITKILSVPLTHQQEEYLLYLDVVYANQEQFNDLISQLKKDAEGLKNFGNYKRQD